MNLHRHEHCSSQEDYWSAHYSFSGHGLPELSSWVPEIHSFKTAEAGNIARRYKRAVCNHWVGIAVFTQLQSSVSNCRIPLMRDGTKLRKGKWRGKQDSTSHSNAKTCQQQTELADPHICSKHGLVRSAQIRKLSSAHVPSQCNRALFDDTLWIPVSSHLHTYQAKLLMYSHTVLK
jgi:hypothetical protein